MISLSMLLCGRNVVLKLVVTVATMFSNAFCHSCTERCGG